MLSSCAAELPDVSLSRRLIAKTVADTTPPLDSFPCPILLTHHDGNLTSTEAVLRLSINPDAEMHLTDRGVTSCSYWDAR